MIRALLHAEAAVVTCRHVLLHLQNLKLRLRMEDFEEISHNAERSEKHSPRNVGTEHVSKVICSEEHADPQPELERIRNSSERAEVTAPEHVHEEAAEHHDADRNDRHPEGDLALESCCYRIVRVKVLAEQFAGLDCRIEYPEQKCVLHDAEHLVSDRSVTDLERLDVHCITCLADEVLHCAERADECAEQLAEKHHSRNQSDTHHHLKR